MRAFCAGRLCAQRTPGTLPYDVYAVDSEGATAVSLVSCRPLCGIRSLLLNATQERKLGVEVRVGSRPYSGEAVEGDLIPLRVRKVPPHRYIFAPTLIYRPNQEVRLCIVAVGEMEGFSRSTGGHSPSWVQQAIDRREIETEYEHCSACRLVRWFWKGRRRDGWTDRLCSPSSLL